MHSAAAHPTAAQQAGKACEGCPQAERVKRPTLTLSGQSISQEDNDHFLYQFGLYKKRLGPGYNSASILRLCLADQVHWAAHGHPLRNQARLTRLGGTLSPGMPCLIRTRANFLRGTLPPGMPGVIL